MEAQMSFLSFQINELNSEIIEKNDGSVIYRHRLLGITSSGSLCLSVKQFNSINGPSNLMCCANLAIYANNNISNSSNIVFGYPKPLKINQTEEELLVNCPCIRHTIYVYGGDYSNVLDILFFNDTNIRKGINPGKGWFIQVNVVQPENKNKLPVLQEIAPKSVEILNTKKPKKEKIPAAVKNTLWYKYFSDSIIGKCQCCKIESISKSIFDAGHIVSEYEGGKVELSNLRPICKLCNSSMGKMNMDVFIKKYGF
jgi:hypothetical protein